MSAMANAFGALDRSGKLPRLAVMLPLDHGLSGARHEVIAGVSRSIDTLLGLHAPFTVIADWDLARLPKSIDQLIAPLPYVLSDAAFDQLVAFVARGGSLVVTGDLRYDEFHRAHPERLAKLFGITAGTPIAPLDMSGPGTKVSLAGVEMPAHLAAPPAAGVFTAGKVLYVPAPIELETSPKLRDFYAAMLSRLGAERLGVTPDAADLHVFRIDLNGGGRAYLVWNEGPARDVSIDDAGGPRRLTVGARTWGLSTP
jgi:hypothetical protein